MTADVRPPGGPLDTPAWTRRPAGLSTAVTHELVRRIVSGALPAGSALPTEPTLCETFSVSRTVVRESVKMLQEKGLVLVRQGSGTVITAPDSWNLLDQQVLAAAIEGDRDSGILDDLVVTRRLLEADMAFVAARTIDDEGLTRLRGLVDLMDTLVTDWAGYMPRDKEFHDVIMNASGNRIARGVVRSLEFQAADTARYIGSPDAAGCTASNRGHREIYERIVARDGAGAAEAMARHISEAWLARRADRVGAERLER
ncbi:FadR/GntR family transcriptional regulator [Pseudonocardia sp. MH-G8]|uniref:FadR/GntR family transcriptional regulator n=1 Tax=Pseudonocardia sp. MH-G8 TaxID=1854588 RepID=UPI000BA13DAA|nr:FadR/GntR family transcriptional regulator [Pseudonocardia sp. MH-G8]OZM78783.1 GntR family transcriptional regulator [Pseudonocardia sp. MH-G8]